MPNQAIVIARLESTETFSLV